MGKEAKRAIRKAASALRQKIAERTPEPVRRRLDPTIRQFDLLIGDYGVFRLLYANRHRVGQQAWRSAQPAPYHIASFARQGIKTVVNLRGEKKTGNVWRMEEEACARHGIRLVSFPVRSRDAPTREQIAAARELFAAIEYPALFHCKSGADRAGLMCALYRHFQEGWPIETAMRELSVRFGHVRQADTGILDYFFQRYLEANARSPITFEEWVRTAYDPAELKRTYRARGWANRLVNGVLRRE